MLRIGSWIWRLWNPVILYLFLFLFINSRGMKEQETFHFLNLATNLYSTLPKMFVTSPNVQSSFCFLILPPPPTFFSLNWFDFYTPPPSYNHRSPSPVCFFSLLDPSTSQYWSKIASTPAVAISSIVTDKSSGGRWWWERRDVSVNSTDERSISMDFLEKKLLLDYGVNNKISFIGHFLLFR